MHPSEYVDDVDFQNLFSPKFGCSFFKHAVYNCYSWEDAVSEAQISDLLASYPVSCGMKIDIFNGPVLLFSASYFLDQGPIFHLILSSEVPGQIVRITKTVPDEVLSLFEVQIFGH